MLTARFFALAAVPFMLLGCAETAPSSSPPPAAEALRTGSPADEQACELAVTRQTNNPDIVTLSSEFSEANTLVIIGVGADRAKWKCLVSKGKVAEVTSLTNEGSL
jgi:hypothetical protein